MFMLKKICAAFTFVCRAKLKGAAIKILEKNIFQKCFRILPRKIRKILAKEKVSKWLLARQLVSKYLREKERINLINHGKKKTIEEQCRLSIAQYTPFKLIVKKTNSKVFEIEEESVFSDEFEEQSSFNEEYSKTKSKTFMTNQNSKNLK